MLKTRHAAVLALPLVLACANVEDPPGGPPDAAPPQVLALRPDSGAVVPNLEGDAVIRFDEVIDEMAGGRDDAGLAKYVLLSPVRGDVRVRWARSAIEVRPRENWRPGRVYRLEILPGILDLRRNVMRDGRVIVFSTGPSIPEAEIRGTAVQWVEQRVAPTALIAAARLPDTIPWLTVADSSGRFRLGAVPPGEYLLYAILDQNQNRRRDPREAYDSAVVRVDSTASVVLWTFVHDTLGSRLRTADFVDSTAVRLSFSQALDPATPLDTSRIRVLALPDSTPVAVTQVLRAAVFDSLVARERAAARAADSTRRAAQDTARAGDTTRVAPPRPRDDAIRVPAPETPPPTAAGDTAALRALLRQRPVPSDRLVIRMRAPLAPGAKYLVRVLGARNLSGAVADGEAVLSVPAAAPPPPAAAPRPARP